MKVALAQTNSTIGDLPGNAARMLSFARQAAAGGAHLVVFPELSLTGYPPRDLLEKQSFLDRTEDRYRLTPELGHRHRDLRLLDELLELGA